MRNREGHIQFCKETALRYLEEGKIRDAYSSLATGLLQHPETKDHIAVELGLRLMQMGRLSTSSAMRKFIEGVA